jgi:hypothetical protein
VGIDPRVMNYNAFNSILAIFFTFLEINSHIMAHIEADGHI